MLAFYAKLTGEGIAVSLIASLFLVAPGIIWGWPFFVAPLLGVLLCWIAVRAFLFYSDFRRLQNATLSLFNGFASLARGMPENRQEKIASALSEKIKTLPFDPKLRFEYVRQLQLLTDEAEYYTKLSVRHACVEMILKEERILNHGFALLTEKLPPKAMEMLKARWNDKLAFHLKRVADIKSKYTGL